MVYILRRNKLGLVLRQSTTLSLSNAKASPHYGPPHLIGGPRILHGLLQQHRGALLYQQGRLFFLLEVLQEKTCDLTLSHLLGTGE